MIMDKNIVVKIKRIQEIVDNEDFKLELYSIITNLILSKDIFKSNKEVGEFLDKIDISFKDYVMNSRTMILARTLRIINKSEEEDLIKYKSTLNELIVSDELKKEDKKNKKVVNDDKYIDNILKKYSRNNRVKNGK